MAELIEDVLELLAPWPTANALATTLQFESANEASTSAQLAVPLLVSGMSQRMNDPAAAPGVLDLLARIDTDGLQDLEATFSQRLFDPVGTEAVDQLLGAQRRQAGDAVAEEVGCPIVSSHGVFPAMAWMVLAVIVNRHGADHSRYTLLNVVEQEKAALLRTGWGEWMSVVVPDVEAAAPEPADDTVLGDATVTGPVDAIGSAGASGAAGAAASYPPPVARESREPLVDPSAYGQPVEESQPVPEPVVEPVLQPTEPIVQPDVVAKRSEVEEAAARERRRTATVPRSSADDDASADAQADLGPAPPGRGPLLLGVMLTVALAGAAFWYLNIRDESTRVTGSRVDETEVSADATQGGDADADADGATDPDGSQDSGTEDTGAEGIAPIIVSLEDPSGARPDITGTATLRVDVDGGQICYEIGSEGFDGAPSGVISQSDDGQQGRAIADFGRIVDTANGCVPADPAQLKTVLDDPKGHFVSLFSPDRTVFITGQLFDPGWPEIEARQLIYAPDEDGAVAVINGGQLALEGQVPDEQTVELLLEEFVSIGELEEADIVNQLEVVADAPNPSGRIVIQDDLLFGVGSADLAEASSPSLALVVRLFAARPDWQVTITGHTDNTGNAINNLALSQARAETVRERLIELGVSGFALESLGVGDSEPVADNATEAGRELNRRIEFQVRSRSNE